MQRKDKWMKLKFIRILRLRLILTSFLIFWEIKSSYADLLVTEKDLTQNVHIIFSPFSHSKLDDTTGKYSVHTQFEGYDIMYHVAPFLPFQEHDEQRVERKRHLGNDVVLIVFKEGNTPFNPKCIRSHFNHIFVVVQVYSKTPEKTLYKVAVATKGGVEPFGPNVPMDGIFSDTELFRRFLLTKGKICEGMINSYYFRSN
jgi:hypothetical protein